MVPSSGPSTIDWLCDPGKATYPLCAVFLKMRGKGMKVLCKVAWRHHFRALVKKGGVFPPDAFLEPWSARFRGWAFFPTDIQEHGEALWLCAGQRQTAKGWPRLGTDV